MKNLFLILFTITCFSQTPSIEWQKSYGGSNIDDGFSIIQTNDGGYIAVGDTQSNDIISLNNYHGSQDLYVVKTNNSGDIEWQKTIGGAGYDVGTCIIQTQDNGYIISGYTSSNDGDIPLNHGSFDCLVVKLDYLGNIVWLKTYGGSHNDNSYTIIQTNEGGYIMVGTTESNDAQVSQNKGLMDGWIVKLDALGTIEWEKTVGGTNIEYLTSAMQTSDNGYILVGHTFSNDGDVTQNQGNCDGWILKLNPSGIIEWQKTYGGSEIDYLFAIKQIPEGGYITCGQSESSNGNLTTNRGLTDAWILKLDSLGNIVWNTTYGGSADDGLGAIIETSNGDYIMTGATQSNDFDVTTNNGEVDGWIVKVNSTGNLIWQKNLGGSDLDQINGIVKTSDNGFSCVGYANSNNGDVTVNHGASELWIVKLTPEPLSNSTFQSENLSVYPNPTTTLLNLQTTQLGSIEKVRIIDMVGKVMELPILNSNQIRTQNLTAGTYFIEVVINHKIYHSKFIKE